MLDYFFNPYPDETFYSVLCRYYESIGVEDQAYARRQLMGDRANTAIDTIFPNASIYNVLRNTPAGIFDIRNIILNHTPFLYFMRIYSYEKKMEALASLESGTGYPIGYEVSNTKNNYAPRYCPLCVREDTEIFGEPYYHVEQQIPFSSACIRHRCKLKQINRPLSGIHKLKFYPLGKMDLDLNADYNVSDTEYLINKTIWEYWKAPLSIGQTPGHNNLYQSLINGKYLELKGSIVGVERTALFADLCDFFGREFIEEYFGHNLLKSSVERLKNWTHIRPERYILLQIMTGISTKEVFSLEPVRDIIKDRLIELSKTDRFWTRKEVAAEMKVPPYSVDCLCRKYNIPVFWYQRNPSVREDQKRKSVVRRLTFSEDQFRRVSEVAFAKGYRQETRFIQDVVDHYVTSELSMRPISHK